MKTISPKLVFFYISLSLLFVLLIRNSISDYWNSWGESSSDIPAANGDVSNPSPVKPSKEENQPESKNVEPVQNKEQEPEKNLPEEEKAEKEEKSEPKKVPSTQYPEVIPAKDITEKSSLLPNPKT